MKGSVKKVIKKMAWNTFKNTGNINTFLELVEVENIEKNLKAEEYGNNQNQRNYSGRK